MIWFFNVLLKWYWFVIIEILFKLLLILLLIFILIFGEDIFCNNFVILFDFIYCRMGWIEDILFLFNVLISLIFLFI